MNNGTMTHEYADGRRVKHEDTCSECLGILSDLATMNSDLQIGISNTCMKCGDVHVVCENGEDGTELYVVTLSPTKPCFVHKRCRGALFCKKEVAFKEGYNRAVETGRENAFKALGHIHPGNDLRNVNLIDAIKTGLAKDHGDGTYSIGVEALSGDELDTSEQMGIGRATAIMARSISVKPPKGEEPRRKDPRNNADDAFDAFMNMPMSEWLGLCNSLMYGGRLQPEEQKGFNRAVVARAHRSHEQCAVAKGPRAEGIGHVVARALVSDDAEREEPWKKLAREMVEDWDFVDRNKEYATKWKALLD